ncbi:ATP-grasp domain protein [anaerobic digester metagenome]
MKLLHGMTFMEKKEKITIIRSAVGSMPSWGLISELLKYQVNIIGIDSDPMSFGLFKLDRKYVVPRGNDPDYISSIVKIVETEKCDAILSGPEEELLSLSYNRSKIEKLGCILLSPQHNSVLICTDKYNTYTFLTANEIPTPKLYPDLDSITFPCLIKPRFGRGGTNVYKINDKCDLQYFQRDLDNYVIQEFIHGEEYSVDILADKEGNPLSIVPRLRLETDSGVSVKGKTVYDADIISYCTKIVKKLELFGPSCIQCIKNSKGIYFFDINARFGGGSILSIKADSTIIPNLLKIIKNESPIPSLGFIEGLIMLRNYSEIFIK